MMEYFTGTYAECEAYIQRINILLGYPTDDGATVTYAEPFEHKDKKGVWLFPIKPDVWGPKLKRNVQIADIDGISTDKEKLNRETLDSNGIRRK